MRACVALMLLAISGLGVLIPFRAVANAPESPRPQRVVQKFYPFSLRYRQQIEQQIRTVLGNRECGRFSHPAHVELARMEEPAISSLAGPPLLYRLMRLLW